MNSICGLRAGHRPALSFAGAGRGPCDLASPRLGGLPLRLALVVSVDLHALQHHSNQCLEHIPVIAHRLDNQFRFEHTDAGQS